jgi:Flp pilus assembly protein TadG
MAMLILGGMVVDGSRTLNARGRAQAYAEEAARAGATAVDLTSVNLAVNPQVAGQRVADYCTVVRGRGAVTECYLVGIDEVSANDDRKIVVHTHVALRIQTSLLGMVGVQSLGASADATARPFEGVTVRDAG